MKHMKMNELLYLRQEDTLIFEPKEFLPSAYRSLLTGKGISLGKRYALKDIEIAYKSGEGSIAGFLIDVGKGETVPFEYFVIDGSLEAKLKQRKADAPNEQESLMHRGLRARPLVGSDNPDFYRKDR